LSSVRLSDKAREYPGRLSGGQQQRAAIARAIAMEPVLLLFDEITSALDPQLKSEVVYVLEELAAQNRTMILVTHEMAFARRSGSQIIFMHDGKIWEKGDPKVLFENPNTEEFRSFLSKVIR
jgi:ABC-type polar amino acid transport system ATPase subunit